MQAWFYYTSLEASPGCPQMLSSPWVSMPHPFSLFFGVRLQTGSSAWCILRTAPLAPPVDFYSCSKAQLRWPFFLAAKHRGHLPSVLPLLDSQALLFLNVKILYQARVLLHCFFLSVSLQGYIVTFPLGSPVLDTLLQLLPTPPMTSSPGPTHTSTFRFPG